MIFKKIVVTFLLIAVLFTSVFTPVAHAQIGQGLRNGPWYFQGVQQWYRKVYDTSNPTEIFGERYTAAQVNWIIWAVMTWPTTATLGPAGGNCLASIFSLQLDSTECARILSSTGYSSVAQSESDQSLISALVEDRPLSGITYIKNVAKKVAAAPEVNAQSPGFGFSALSPIQDLWTSARNLSYALMTLAIVIVAFMVMFRVKLSPQVVITAQSMIPKIVIALVLITFSYAIAGLLVDLMYLIIGLISLLLTPGDPVDTFNYLTKGPQFTSNVPTGVFGIMVSYFVQFIFAFFITMLGGADGVIGTFEIALNAFSPIFMIMTVVVSLILFILLLISFLKILLVLFKAVAMVLIFTILAPVAAVIGIITPGFGFSTWIKAFLSHLMVFPTVGLFLLLAHIFLDAAVQNIAVRLDVPGFTSLVRNVLGADLAFRIGSTTGSFGGGWPPLLGLNIFFGPNLVFLGASLVVLMMAPKAAEIVKGLITGRPFFGNAIGESAALGAGLARASQTRRMERIDAIAKRAGRSPYDLPGGIGTEYTGRRVVDTILGAVQKGGR